LGQFTIIRQQQQSFAVIIEPTNRKQASCCLNQAHNRRAALGIVGGRDDASRLMQHNIRSGLDLAKWATINRDLIAFGIDAGAGNTHNFAIHGNAAGADQFLTIAAGGNARTGEDLL
jgi:hypothetical protein